MNSGTMDSEDLPAIKTYNIFELPAEIIQHIVSFLSLQDICQLGGTCHVGYNITHDEKFWSVHLAREYNISYVSDLADLNLEQDTAHGHLLEGIIHDPTLQGNREMSVIYSTQFKRIMIEKNINRNKQVQDPFRSMLENSLGDILPKLLAFYVNLPAEEQCSARLVLFGPGIESEHTKLLVHKIVSARSSTFDAVEFIKGLPGGIGSGVRINYKHMYNFDLMCLYSNSATIRNSVISEKGYFARLDPQLNKILTHDLSGKPVLQSGISKLIPTVHALVFAIDATSKNDVDEDNLDVMRQELGVLLESQEKFNTPTPVLILSCYTLSRNIFWTPSQIVIGLRLNSLSRPWAVYQVCCDNMKGIEKGLDWVLHHLAKRRREWQYHMKQGQS